MLRSAGSGVNDGTARLRCATLPLFGKLLANNQRYAIFIQSIHELYSSPAQQQIKAVVFVAYLEWLAAVRPIRRNRKEQRWDCPEMRLDKFREC